MSSARVIFFIFFIITVTSFLVEGIASFCESNRYPLLFNRSPTEAETGENDIHAGAVRRSGRFVCQDEVSGYLYARRGCPQDQPSRVQGTGASLNEASHYTI